jgi:hypothetical protein
MQVGLELPIAEEVEVQPQVGRILPAAEEVTARLPVIVGEAGDECFISNRSPVSRNSERTVTVPDVPSKSYCSSSQTLFRES